MKFAYVIEVKMKKYIYIFFCDRMSSSLGSSCMSVLGQNNIFSYDGRDHNQSLVSYIVDKTDYPDTVVGVIYSLIWSRIPMKSGLIIDLKL